MRTGLIAKKMGMTRIYREDGTHVPVTVMQLEACQVVGQRTAEKNGYSSGSARRRRQESQARQQG